MVLGGPPINRRSIERLVVMDADVNAETEASEAEPKRELPEAAKRALAEAQARRDANKVEAAAAADLPKEINGRGGKEPTRYADWEVKGIAVDF